MTQMTKNQIKTLKAIVAATKIPIDEVDGRSLRALWRLGYVAEVVTTKGTWIKVNAAGRKALN